MSIIEEYCLSIVEIVETENKLDLAIAVAKNVNSWCMKGTNQNVLRNVHVRTTTS